MTKQVAIANVADPAAFTFPGSKEKTFKFHTIQIDTTGTVSGGTFDVEVKTQGSDNFVEIASKDLTSEAQVFNIDGLFDEIQVTPNSITGATEYTVTIASV